MERFTAIHHDDEQNEYFRVIISAKSADDVEVRIKQKLYEWQLEEGHFDAEDVSDLSSFGWTLCVFAGDHPNLITPDQELRELIIPADWEPSDETPTE